MDLWGTLRKYGPFAAVAGYILLYFTQKSNGVYQILPDLKSVTVQKLMGKWQNFAVAGVAFIALQFLHKIKMPAAMRALLQVGLYFLIGWEIALAIDPPSSVPISYRPTARRNPYQIGG